ncbi:MAG TPA: adenosylmethionine--8-amino-7-oxononanoate transaminase [Gammaproteobacteria bacterium]|nr:adenosylmethionine--8-amino-7-oxononanoate transaminase [Gammaproteobacteria bacterium]
MKDDLTTLSARLAYDKKHLWHPYSSMITPGYMHEVSSASGVHLTLSDGRSIIDGMASWWAVIHGYNHPVLNQAAVSQIDCLAHVMFGGLTHAPAVTLSQQLIEITHPVLQHVFFSDSGSISVEVAIKMALQYWIGREQPNKKRLLTVRHGYHGDTFAAMSVSDPENGMHHLFQGSLIQQLFAPAPVCRHDDDWRQEEMETLTTLLAQHQQEIAAVIIEPLVQGAGGMRVYCAEYLRQLRRLCDSYDVLLILDEIATGFGRTGSLFAYEQAGIAPDILCLGKALTGGYISLAATLCSTAIAEGMSANGDGVLMHGPTFMANPLACAIANASIGLLLSSPWQQRVAAIEQQLRQALSPYMAKPLVKDVRVKGAIGVIELKETVWPVMDWLPKWIVDQGVWIRPFNNLIYIMPPYTIQAAELMRLTEVMGRMVDKIAAC